MTKFKIPLPLNSSFVRDEAARDLGEICVHQFDNLFEVVLATTQVGLADLVFAFSSCPTSHLTPEEGINSHPGNMYMWYPVFTYNNEGPTRSRPIRAL